MRIAATADFHRARPSVPSCDLLIVAGDLGVHLGTTRYTGQLDGELNDFRRWLEATPATAAVVIGGNHDDWLEGEPDLFRRVVGFVEPVNAVYLQDEAALVEGVRVYGTPWTPTFFNWAFQKDEPELKDVFAAIPDDTELLITHGPPRGILDETYGGEQAGSLALRQELASGRLADLRLHVFGHIHEQAGRRVEVDGVTYANVSAANGMTWGADPLAPLVFDWPP